MNLASKKGSSEPFLILDSKHITPTFLKLYNIKLVDCDDYVQVYIYTNKKIKTNKDDNVELNLKKIKISTMVETEVESNEILLKNKNELKHHIEDRSIIRSKLECQRIAKANMKEWETFITLTFADNITNIKYANTRFRYFVDKVRRVKKDFKYLCIPEFQKRGAVHYHMLCNIKITDDTLLYVQEDNTKYKHIKYWNDGFTSVEPMKSDSKKVIGYISKYMTKNIDQRLFGYRRYVYSQNLLLPKKNYINSDVEKDKEFYKKIIQDKELIYQNEYINPFDNSKVIYLEFSKKETLSNLPAIIPFS